ncbi:MAG: hypothetical protein WCJ30_01825 [Deltaproteobacteria bacterium]
MSQENLSNNNRPSYQVRVGIWNDRQAIAVWETILEASTTGLARHVFTTRLTSMAAGVPAAWVPAVPIQIDHAPYYNLATDTGLALGTNGVAYVVWRDARTGSGDVYFQRTGDHGTTWLAADVRLNTQSGAGFPHDAIQPSIAASSDTVYVAWTELRIPTAMPLVPDRYDIYANVSTNAGMNWQAVSTRVETDGLKHDSYRPNMVALSTTIGAVVWEDWRSGHPNARATRTTDSGVTWAAQDYPAEAGGAGGPGSSTSSNVIAVGAGTSVYVVWQDDRDEPAVGLGGVPHYNIYANFSLDSGQMYQPQDIRLDTAAIGTDQITPAAFTLNNVGHFAWVDRRNTSSTGVVNFQGDIYYRNLH